MFNITRNKSLVPMVAILAATILTASCGKNQTMPTSTNSESQMSTTVATTSTQVTSLVSPTVEATTQAPTPIPTTVATTAAPTPAPVGLEPERTNLRGELAAEGQTLARPVAVMIDNHPDARPQAGLRDADIVFEIPVEGGLTRYMAIFQSSTPTVVGPVRSARDAYLDRILEFDSVYVHIGGSPTADERLATDKYEDINGSGRVIWRKNDTGKVAPHNAYTNISLVRKYMANIGWHEEPVYEKYSFYQEGHQPGGAPANQVEIEATSETRTAYKYLADKGVYTRSKDGKEDLDENDSKPLEVTNILVQKTDITAGYGGYPTLRQIPMIGKGDGYYISMGEIIPITWMKDRLEGLTRYYKVDGSELILNPGQTWIQVIDLAMAVSATD